MKKIQNLFLKQKDVIILNKALKEIKKLPNVISIIQIGSSTYSKNYKDIDIIIFFNKVLPSPNLGKINQKYKKHKIWIEGTYVEDYKITRGMKVFIKFFSNLKKKIVLYGKDPYKNKKISLNKLDIAHYIWYHYHFALYTLNYDSILSTSLNAMLTYKNIFPENKDETLKLFKKNYQNLAKFLPKNAEHYLKNTNSLNFRNLHKFFQESLIFFSK